MTVCQNADATQNRVAVKREWKQNRRPFMIWMQLKMHKT